MKWSGSVDVVIPVLNESAHTDSILSDIVINTVQPKQVVVVDNGSTDNTSEVVKSFEDKLPIVYIQKKVNVGVNAAWNLGIKLATSDYVSVLNNDLILNKHFFEGILKAFTLNPKCGMVCPRTVQGDAESQKHAARNCVISDGNCVSHVPWRWGWAFTIKRKLGLKVLIPRTLFNYCGDDYHYHFLKLLGYDILAMDDNVIYHYGGITGRNSGLDKTMSNDTHHWNLIKREIDERKDWRLVLKEQASIASFGENGDGTVESK